MEKGSLGVGGAGKEGRVMPIRRILKQQRGF